MILTPYQKLPKNVEDLGKLIVSKGLKKLPRVKKIAQSGHTEFTETKICKLDILLPTCFEAKKTFKGQVKSLVDFCLEPHLGSTKSFTKFEVFV